MVASDVGNGSLVNLGGVASSQQIATTPRPLVAGVQPTALPIGTQPARPVPPAQSPLGKAIIYNLCTLPCLEIFKIITRQIMNTY